MYKSSDTAITGLNIKKTDIMYLRTPYCSNVKWNSRPLSSCLDNLSREESLSRPDDFYYFLVFV